MSNENIRALSMLSLAAKAGKVVSGGFMTERAIQDKSACLVIIAENASANTRKKFTDKCRYYNLPCIVMFSSDILGNQIGKQDRTSVAIIDEGFAKQILNKLDGSIDMEV